MEPTTVKKKTPRKGQASRGKENNALFEKEYAKLNVAQKLAVETIEGPVMVVAGPGTGKTQTLSMRVANILKKTQMRPSNILCLTYSVSGATAMRERLRMLIGPDAYGVKVTTIHGFCHNDVIQSYPHVFDEYASLEHVTDVQRFQFMNELIDELPVDCAIVSPKDRYARTGEILGRISQVKREGLSVEKLQEIAVAYREEMEHKSKPETKVHQRNLKLARQYEEFIGLFEGYERALREKNLYDYDDMILFVLKALKEEDWLLSTLQERYQYILVDEFQDTNGSQNALIESLTTYPEGIDQQPNLFVVGDDDQAIYRFQGANVANMLQFRSRFPESPVITLTESYRSTQPVLDAASSLISHNEDRLVNRIPSLQKTLKSALPVSTGSMPALLRPVSDVVSGLVICERIEDFLKQGIPAREIAILTRTNEELFELYDALKCLSVPAQITGKLDLLRNAKILECLTLLKAVGNPQDDGLLSAALAAQCFGCHPADLGLLWSVLREEQRTEQGRRRLTDILLRLEKLAAENQLRVPEALLNARDTILSLSQRFSSMALPAIVEQLMKRSGLLPKLGDGIAPLDLIALQEFFEHVKRRYRESAAFGLQDLLREIQYREKYGLRLNYDVPHLVDEGVQLMTAHGAKGLEFEVVILSHFREKHWDHKRSPPKLALPDHLLFAAEQGEDIDLQDERRLAYVAWTRAKKILLFLCPERMSRGEREQDISPSQFFSEGGSLPESAYEIEHPERAATLLMTSRTLSLDEQMKTFIRRRLETFELSPTALNHFLEDPEKFLWEDLLDIPRIPEPQMAYGSAVHRALKEWGDSAQRGHPLSADEFFSAFVLALQRYEILSEQAQKQWIHVGETALSRYYRTRLTAIPLIHSVERRLSARLDDIPLKGFIDRIDLYVPDGAKVHVIDYKTGVPKTEKQIREENGGAMFRQIAFYKLLLEHSSEVIGYEATELSVDFIGERDDEPKRITFKITEEEISALRKLIERVWAKILALDFTAV